LEFQRSLHGGNLGVRGVEAGPTRGLKRYK
jgi:hypothetical protein